MKCGIRIAAGLVAVLWGGVAPAAPPDYTAARKLAEELKLAYQATPPGGKIPYAVALSAPKHRVMLYADTTIATVDGKLWSLDRPVIAEEGDLFVPPGLRSRLAKHLRTAVKPAVRAPSKAAPFPSRARASLVVIDPGHGGRDPGASRPLGRGRVLREKDIVLDVSKQVAVLLRKAGVHVVMTRKTDVFVTLPDRVKTGNRYNPDLFVSIHADAAAPSAHGSTVYYADDQIGRGKADITYRARIHARETSVAPGAVGSPGRLSESVEAVVFGVLLQEYRSRSRRAGEHILRSVCRAAGTTSRGVRQANFRVVRYMRRPSVLVELEYVSNAKARRRLLQSGFRRQLARGIVEGVVAYLRDRPKAKK